MKELFFAVFFFVLAVTGHSNTCVKSVPFSFGNSTLGASGTRCLEVVQEPSILDKFLTKHFQNNKT